MSEQTDDAKRRVQLRDILEHFKGGPNPTTEILAEYCNRKGYEPLGAGDYEDWKYQYEHDARLTAIIPKIMAVLSKLQNIPELATEDERRAALEANDQLEVDVCELIEEGGILYSEVDLVTSQLGGNLKQMMDAVATRIGNNAGTMLLRAAKEKYGDPLTVKALGEASREVTPAAPIDAKTDEASQ